MLLFMKAAAKTRPVLIGEKEPYCVSGKGKNQDTFKKLYRIQGGNHDSAASRDIVQSQYCFTNRGFKRMSPPIRVKRTWNCAGKEKKRKHEESARDDREEIATFDRIGTKPKIDSHLGTHPNAKERPEWRGCFFEKTRWGEQCGA